jgi:hypothetical protein
MRVQTISPQELQRRTWRVGGTANHVRHLPLAYRGSIAASFLIREGYEGFWNVLGGMTAWKIAGLPVSQA